MENGDVSPDTLVAATNSLLAFLEQPHEDGSTWVRSDDLHWLRIDAFGKSIKATIYTINDFGVVDLSSAVVITRPTAELVAPVALSGEMDIDKAARRYEQLVKMGEVGVKFLAWNYLQSGDTLIGMDLEQIIQFVLGWEIQSHPENFMKETEVSSVRIPNTAGNAFGGLG